MQHLIKGLLVFVGDGELLLEKRELARALVVHATNLLVEINKYFDGSQQGKFVGFKANQGRWLGHEADKFNKAANA